MRSYQTMIRFFIPILAMPPRVYPNDSIRNIVNIVPYMRLTFIQIYPQLTMK